MLTETEACEYAQKIETKWYGAPSAVLSVTQTKDSQFDGQLAFEVQTQENRWAVWREPTGEIYGEC